MIVAGWHGGGVFSTKQDGGAPDEMGVLTRVQAPAGAGAPTYGIQSRLPSMIQSKISSITKIKIP